MAQTKNLQKLSFKILNYLQLYYSSPREEVKFVHVMLVTCLDI